MAWRIRRTINLQDRPYEQVIAPTDYATAELAFDAAMDNALQWLKNEFTVYGTFGSKIKFWPIPEKQYRIEMKVSRVDGMVLWEMREFN